MTAAAPPGGVRHRRSRWGSSRRRSPPHAASAARVVAAGRRRSGIRYPGTGPRDRAVPATGRDGTVALGARRGRRAAMTLPALRRGSPPRSRRPPARRRPLRHRPQRGDPRPDRAGRALGAVAVAGDDLRLLAVAYAVSGSATSSTAGRPAARPGDPGRCRVRHRERPRLHRPALRRPGRAPPVVHPVVAVFLLSFMVLDTMLSLAFLCWPVLSPNYFHLVDRTVWRLNWSPLAKAANTAGVVGALALGCRTPSLRDRRRGRRGQVWSAAPRDPAARGGAVTWLPNRRSRPRSAWSPPCCRSSTPRLTR